jgi:hypothetical protein
MTDTPTPRTDENAAWSNSCDFDDKFKMEVCESSFARQLERELTAVTEQRDRLQDVIDEYAEDKSRLATMAMVFKEQRDRLEIALNHSTGVITSLGEVEPDIYNLLLDARDKRTGEEYQLSVVDVLEIAIEALQSLTNPNEP